MSEVSRREALRTAVLLGGFAPLGCLGNILQEDKTGNLEKRVRELEQKLTDSPKDKKLAQELIAAHHELGSRLFDQKDKTSSKSAQRVLDLIKEKDLAYQGIDKHITESNFILGSNYLAEDTKKGLDHMYTAAIWGEDKQSDKAVSTVVDHYEKTGVHHVVREFKRGRLYTQKLLEKLQSNYEEAEKTGNYKWVIEGKDAEDAEHTINFYHQLAVHTLEREIEKPKNKRDYAYPLNHFFRSITIAHHTLIDKKQVFRNIDTVYSTFRKAFDGLPSIEKAYTSWAAQILSDEKNAMPGVKPLLEALIKRREF